VVDKADGFENRLGGCVGGVWVDKGYVTTRHAYIATRVHARALSTNNTCLRSRWSEMKRQMVRADS
jgi:hypothetical protein